MNENRRKILVFLKISLAVLLFLIITGFIIAVSWTSYNVEYPSIEDTPYYHNLSANITDPAADMVFSVDTIETTILWNGVEISYSNISSWVYIINSSTGNFTINSTRDNETGHFVIPFKVTWNDGQSASTESFNFTNNATNDAPNFTTANTTYNLTQNQLFFEYINASDEEEHYPLHFNISFYDNCTHASWSNRNTGENCSIFNLLNIANTSALMNFTPSRNDVGTYWANITITDFGENYSCPHSYCDNITYEQNKTTYSEIIQFNIFASLEINASNCQNKIFQENQSGTCWINITTKGESDSLNISSLGFLRNYDASVANNSWFYSENLTNASSFTTTIFINTTPQKTEIGNWTINFTVQDITSGENLTEQIYVYVNKTLNDLPEIVNIENTNTSVDLPTRINLTVYDDDLLIPDKLEGYNETITFNVTILNQSNLNQELNLAGFDVEILNMPVSGTNRTEAKIEFTPSSSEAGNYTINITINDSEGALDSEIFNLSIISNAFPSWNQTSYSFDLVVNSTFTTTASFGPINLTDGYVTDVDDTLTLTNDSSAFPRFNLSSEGMISFTPYKEDVGNWSFSVTATDSLGLQNTTTFIFNITNINSEPLIETPIQATNAHVEANSNTTAQEDNYTKLTLWVQDDDFKISSAKKSYYNENITINLTIEGPNPNLFSFTKTNDFPIGNFQNRTEYDAIFTPNSTDVGTYNITINITDAGNSSDVLEFNLTVNNANDAPVLTDIANQTSAVNRTLFYSINATDEEDGNQSQGNLVFNLTFLSGTNFINNNETIFNTTSGVLNITFNDTQAGAYRINITVNDSENLKDSDDFWIYVYDAPNVVYPAIGENFSLQENSTVNLTFQVNHSVGDNLTYKFYVSNILRNTTIYYGNATNLTWQYTPNFTDETYGQVENLTLIVYPANSKLANKTNLNTTINRDINISHTNSPVSFSGHVGDTQANYNQDITIDLSTYFSDIDYSDTAYNQTVNFSIISNSTSSYISCSVSNWSLTLSSLIAISELITINASDLNLTNSNYTLTSTLSNEFKITFTAPVTVTVPTPSGGSSTIVPVSLKIIVPDPVSAYKGDRIVLPITLHNDGKKSLSDIDLISTLVKNNLIRDDIIMHFDPSHFSSLAIGEKKNTTLTIDINTNETGTFEITINASVKNPEYTDWGKLYLTVKKGDNIEERILFTQEFLAENPECIELEEILDEAREHFSQGDFVNTVIKINQAIEGCKNAISQQARAQRKEKTENPLYIYLLIATLTVFFMGIVYYSYQRMKLKRSYKENILQERNENTLQIIIIIGGMIGFIATIKTNIIGFAINNVSLINQNKFSLSFIFILGILGFLIFLSREKIKVIIEKTREKIREKYSKNKIKSLFNKKVYTDLGDYLGKIDEVILGKNKIKSLRIKLDFKTKKKNKIKTKGIIVNYKYVKSVGHIIIVKGKIRKI